MVKFLIFEEPPRTNVRCLQGATVVACCWPSTVVLEGVISSDSYRCRKWLKSKVIALVKLSVLKGPINQTREYDSSCMLLAFQRSARMCDFDGFMTGVEQCGFLYFV